MAGIDAADVQTDIRKKTGRKTTDDGTRNVNLHSQRLLAIALVTAGPLVQIVEPSGRGLRGGNLSVMRSAASPPPRSARTRRSYSRALASASQHSFCWRGGKEHVSAGTYCFAFSNVFLASKTNIGMQNSLLLIDRSQPNDVIAIYQ